jgi:hypothetical protein
LNNLRQVVMACHNYQSSNQKFPTAAPQVAGVAGARSWVVPILSNLDNGNIYDEAKTGISEAALSSNFQLSMLVCADATQEDESATTDPSQQPSHYAPSMGPVGENSSGYVFSSLPTIGSEGAVGLTGMFSPKPLNVGGTPTIVRASFKSKYGKGFEDCRDGSSNTIVFVEHARSQTDNWSPIRAGWAFGVAVDSSDRVDGVLNANSVVGFNAATATEVATPVNANLTAPLWNQVPASSNHSGGCQVGRLDGSTSFVNESIDFDAYLAAHGINDGLDSTLE